MWVIGKGSAVEEVRGERMSEKAGLAKRVASIGLDRNGRAAVAIRGERMGE